MSSYVPILFSCCLPPDQIEIPGFTYIWANILPKIAVVHIHSSYQVFIINTHCGGCGPSWLFMADPNLKLSPVVCTTVYKFNQNSLFSLLFSFSLLISFVTFVSFRFVGRMKFHLILVVLISNENMEKAEERERTKT